MNKITQAALPIILIIIGCSNRERNNPLDPGNPVTNGAPVIERIYSNRDRINIEWNRFEVNGLEQYLLYQGVADEPLTLINTLDADTNQVAFSVPQLEQKYRYSLQAITAWDSSRISAEETIIPGPVNLWIADYYAGKVRQLSFDGRHLNRTIGLESPLALALDRQRDRVVIADHWDQLVAVYDLDLTQHSDFHLDRRPVDLTINPANGDIFILPVSDDGFIYHLPGGGGVADTIDFPVSTTTYFSMDFGPADNALWISAGNGAVYRYRLDAGGSFSIFSGIPGRGEVQADQFFGGCYIGTGQGLYHINSDNSLDSLLTGVNITGISSTAGGYCFYTGNNHNDQSWLTGRYNSLTGEFEQLLGAEWDDLYGIQAVPGADEVGFIVNQTGEWRLLRFDHQGNLMGEYEPADAIIDFAIE